MKRAHALFVLPLSAIALTLHSVGCDFGDGTDKTGGTGGGTTAEIKCPDGTVLNSRGALSFYVKSHTVVINKGEAATNGPLVGQAFTLPCVKYGDPSVTNTSGAPIKVIGYTGSSDTTKDSWYLTLQIWYNPSAPNPLHVGDPVVNSQVDSVTGFTTTAAAQFSYYQNGSSNSPAYSETGLPGSSGLYSKNPFTEINRNANLSIDTDGGVMKFDKLEFTHTRQFGNNKPYQDYVVLESGTGTFSKTNTPIVGSGGGTTTSSCGNLNVIWSSGPRNIFAWPEGNTYGVNSFYVWEVDWNGSPDNPDFYWKDTGLPVSNKLPYENWQVPSSLWSAMRFNLDGYDPYHFSLDDMFVMGYLPATPGLPTGSWTSKSGAKNDGTCPNNNYKINGWDRCYGKKQQDPQAPKTLTDGKAYVAMMGMVIPLGTDSKGKKLNRVQSCYMNAFIAEGWGRQGN